jgi:hypothetical protein
MPKKSVKINDGRAFELYYNKGEPRSLRDVAKEIGVAYRSLNRHQTKHGWQDRLKEYNRLAAEQTKRDTIRTVAEMNKIHIRAAELTLAKAITAISQMSFEKAEGAVRSLKIAVEIDRLARGLATSKDEGPGGIAPIVNMSQKQLEALENAITGGFRTKRDKGAT